MIQRRSMLSTVHRTQIPLRASHWFISTSLNRGQSVILGSRRDCSIFHKKLDDSLRFREFSSNGEHRDPSRWPSRSTILMVAIGACGVGSYLNIRNYLNNEKVAALVRTGPAVGRPTLGGPFQLVDHNKKVCAQKITACTISLNERFQSLQTVTERDFKGKWLFIYFGFTYCPDICPNELIRMREVMNILGKSLRLLGMNLPKYECFGRQCCEHV